MFSRPQPENHPHRLPRWAVGRVAPLGAGSALKTQLRSAGLTTVCEQARCPNLATCFERGTATFMVLGDTCTRSCAFCAVAKGRPAAPDADEPHRLAKAAKSLGLSHVVITSVDRDDLADGGAGHFVRCIAAVRETLPTATVEVLVPDFGGNMDAVDTVAAARPEVFNHNLESVPRLYPEVRAGAGYARSLAIVRRAKDAGLLTKSGVMVGLGETDEELLTVFADLRAHGCDVLTVGQYLRPTRNQRPVDRYLTPHAFDVLRERALEMGFQHVAVGPKVRSSMNAQRLLEGITGE
jgi:lipoic acid synthetase